MYQLEVNNFTLILIIVIQNKDQYMLVRDKKNCFNLNVGGHLKMLILSTIS